jgi:hypothetical protein
VLPISFLPTACCKSVIALIRVELKMVCSAARTPRVCVEKVRIEVISLAYYSMNQGERERSYVQQEQYAGMTGHFNSLQQLL